MGTAKATVVTANCYVKYLLDLKKVRIRMKMRRTKEIGNHAGTGLLDEAGAGFLSF